MNLDDGTGCESVDDRREEKKEGEKERKEKKEGEKERMGKMDQKRR